MPGFTTYLATQAGLQAHALIASRQKVSGRGHATRSLAQLAYLSGNRDPRVVALLRGGIPTLKETLDAVQYYAPRISPTAGGIAERALATGQIIPAEAFGFTSYTEGVGPVRPTWKWFIAGSPRQREASVVYGAKPSPAYMGGGQWWLDGNSAPVQRNVRYRSAAGCEELVYNGTIPNMRAVECLAKAGPPAFLPAMTGLGASLPTASYSPQRAAQLRAAGKRFVPTTDWPTLTRNISAARLRMEAAWKSQV